MSGIEFNDECGMMSDELKTALHSSLIIPHSSFRDCGDVRSGVSSAASPERQRGRASFE
jgi:hypothetical protein